MRSLANVIYGGFALILLLLKSRDWRFRKKRVLYLFFPDIDPSFVRLHRKQGPLSRWLIA
jgi:hypothetical protein